jgi:release factor glutamine methyltransferase
LNAPQPSHVCEGLLRSLVQRFASRIKLLPDKPEESVEAAVRALWSCALGAPTSSVAAMSLPLAAPTNEQVDQLIELLERRANGVPLAHLTGRQHFMGLEFKCSTAALIPRRETEILGNAACSLLIEEILPRTRSPRVLDLCTGCGNLACAIACHVPECTVFAADLSADAVGLAEENARFLGCEDRLKVFAGDLFEPFNLDQYTNSFDLITCNPPYISTAKLPQMEPEIIKHEPKMAFDAGPFGLAILGRLLRDAPRYAKPGGWLAFEIGLGQGNGMIQRVSKDERYRHTNGVLDGSKNVRAITAQFCHDEPGLQMESTHRL